MSYHKKPSWYDWDAIIPVTYQTGSSYAQAEVASLMKRLGKKLLLVYGKEETSGLDINVPNALEYFGYTSGLKVTKYSNDGVITEIKNYRPVYASGYRDISPFFDIYTGGHAWVIDGYSVFTRRVQKYRYSVHNPPVHIATWYEKKEFIHCNFGWANDSNGYYRPGVFNADKLPYYPGTKSRGDVRRYYNYKLRIIKGIQ